MADIKRAKNGVARRSTRVFEDDIEFRQTDEYGSDTGVLYNRKRGETEQLPEKDKLAEKNIHMRRASVSSMSATNDEIIGGLDKLKREKSREEVQICQGAVVKKEPKPKVPGRPRNFALVMDGIYRSGYPEAEDHDFLKNLGLKTIVTLVDKGYPEGYQSFMQSSGINHVVIKMEGTKKVDIPESVMSTILDVVLNGQNHPLLIHCNQGRHRTGCTVAAIRRAMGWSIDSILTEYTSFAEPKVREVDVNYIQRFQDEDHIDSSAPRFERLTIVTKPRKLSKSEKMTRMVFITLFILAVFGLTYIQGRFISQAN